MFFIGCLEHSSLPAANAIIMGIFNQLAKINHSKHKKDKDEPVALNSFSLSLDCVYECSSRKEAIKAISQSLPYRLAICTDQIYSNSTVRGESFYIAVTAVITN